MPARTILTLAVAVFLGLLAVVVAQAWLGNQRKADLQSAAVAGTVPVVVAAQPIERGAVLQPASLKIVRFPQASAPQGALGSLEEANAGGQRLALRTFAPNEPILTSRITTPGGKLNLSAGMTAGMRAVTFRSDDVSGVAGFVLPGDRVDVMLTRETSGENKSTVTQIVADNLRVLGVDQVDDESANKPIVAKAITLEVTPEQAQAISLARAVGDVSLALRPISDRDPVAKRFTTVADLGGAVRSQGARLVKTVYRPRAAATVPGPAEPVGPKVAVTRGIVTTEYAVTH